MSIVGTGTEVTVYGTEEPMPVVRTGLLPHQGVRPVLSPAPTPPPPR